MQPLVAAQAPGIAPHFVEQRGQARVAGPLDLALQADQQMRAPLAQVANPRRQPFGVEARTEDVDRRRQQMGRQTLDQEADARVAGDQVPPAVDDDGGVGLVGSKESVHGAAHGSELRCIDVVLGVAGA